MKADDAEMPDHDDWWAERPRRPPGDYATRLARKRVWRNVDHCFIATVPDIQETEGLLQLDVEMGHALVFVLSRLPAASRRRVADGFYSLRPGSVHRDPPPASSRAAAIASMVLPLTQRPDLDTMRIADVLVAIQQGDDVSAMPPTAVAEIANAVARARVDLERENQRDPRSAATMAVIEVLDPSSDNPAVQEVLMRATWATLMTSGTAGVIEFLFAVDALRATNDDV